MVALDRAPIADFTASTADGVLTLRTSALVLRYRIDGGRFSPGDLSITSLGGHWSAHPSWSAAVGHSNLGGWIRALDNKAGPVALHPGLLARRGLVSPRRLHRRAADTGSIAHQGRAGIRAAPVAGGVPGRLLLRVRPATTAPRCATFGRLSGPAPLLPRKAFGVWFSRYFAYRASEYPALLRASSASTTCRWTRCRSTPTGSGKPARSSNVSPGGCSARPAPTPGTAGSGTTRCSRTRRRSIAGRTGRASSRAQHPPVDRQHRPEVRRDGGEDRAAAAGPRLHRRADRPAGRVLRLRPHEGHVSSRRTSRCTRRSRRTGSTSGGSTGAATRRPRSAPGLTPDTYLNRQYTKHLHHHGDRWLVLSRVGGSHQGGDPAAGPGSRHLCRAPIGDPLHRRHLRDLADAGVRGEADGGRRQRRDALRQP